MSLYVGRMLMTNLTIKDIAKMCGVSTTSVSFVINNREGVSEATRQKVQEVISRTGFIPNVHTRRLNLGKSFAIHVVMKHYECNLHNQFALETLTGIFNASKALGYSIVFTLVSEPIDCEQIMESVRSKDCDGVILNQVSDPGLLALLQQERIGFVCVDSHIRKDGNLPLVEVDYFHAAYQATQHLVQCGHREIGFLGPDSPSDFHINTFGGYTQALKDAGLVCNPMWMANLHYAQGMDEAEIHAILDAPKLPTAFFCAGDAFAIDVIRCIKQRGLLVPEDISIMSLDDLIVSRYIDPPLSTMTFDKELLGEQAMRLLHQIISGQSYEPVHLIPTTLVSRGSVRQMP